MFKVWDSHTVREMRKEATELRRQTDCVRADLQNAEQAEAREDFLSQLESAREACEGLLDNLRAIEVKAFAS